MAAPCFEGMVVPEGYTHCDPSILGMTAVLLTDTVDPSMVESLVVGDTGLAPQAGECMAAEGLTAKCMVDGIGLLAERGLAVEEIEAREELDMRHLLVMNLAAVLLHNLGVL